MVRYEPDRALATLPALLANHADRERLVALVRRLLADERVQREKPSTEQLAMIANIGETLEIAAPAAKRARRVVPKRTPSAPRKRTTKKRT